MKLLNVPCQLGLEAWKPKQHEAIESYVSGNDTFVVLPIGYGKSVMYAALPMIFDKLRGNKCIEIIDR